MGKNSPAPRDDAKTHGRSPLPPPAPLQGIPYAREPKRRSEPKRDDEGGFWGGLLLGWLFGR